MERYYCVSIKSKCIKIYITHRQSASSSLGTVAGVAADGDVVVGDAGSDDGGGGGGGEVAAVGKWPRCLMGCEPVLKKKMAIVLTIMLSNVYKSASCLKTILCGCNHGV